MTFWAQCTRWSYQGSCCNVQLGSSEQSTSRFSWECNMVSPSAASSQAIQMAGWSEINLLYRERIPYHSSRDYYSLWDGGPRRHMLVQLGVTTHGLDNPWEDAPTDPSSPGKHVSEGHYLNVLSLEKPNRWRWRRLFHLISGRVTWHGGVTCQLVTTCCVYWVENRFSR